MMTRAEIEAVVEAALATLYAEESEIISIDIGERTICSCLAWHLIPYFPNHKVHVEYNRHGVYAKEIELPDAEGELTQNKVFPDIIVHIPGNDGHNLLAIEIKKSTSNMTQARDLLKLACLRDEFHYSHALFLRLSMGEDASAEKCSTDWV